jgi:hypothetical protein
MFTLETASSITIALLAPLWWGLGLFVLAVLGDLSPWWRPRVSRLFDWLERTRVEPPNEPPISRAVAAWSLDAARRPASPATASARAFPQAAPARRDGGT